MQFIDLAQQQSRIRGAIETRIRAVLDHGKYIMGPEVGELEAALAGYTGTRHAVSCASGTDALLLALMAAGVGPGDAVLTSPFTFIATAEVVGLLGAVPVFVDIDPATYNIDPAQLDRAVSDLREGGSTVPRGGKAGGAVRPKAVIPVDLFGLPAEYDAIRDIARQNGLAVIEDAAQSFGAEYRGRKTGALGDIACTSFFPAKPLGCYGDGGMCFTDDDTLADLMRSFRIHGKGTDKYDNVRIGINGRMDTIQAAILLEKFAIFDDEIQRRNAAAGRYRSLLSGSEKLVLPDVPGDRTSVWAQYSILAEDGAHRKAIMDALREKGVPTAIYYPKPLHLQSAFASLGYREGAFPVSEDCSERIFSIPMHPYLDEGQQALVANGIRAAAIV